MTQMDRMDYVAQLVGGLILAFCLFLVLLWLFVLALVWLTAVVLAVPVGLISPWGGNKLRRLAERVERAERTVMGPLS